MRKALLYVLIILFATHAAMAQAPQQINYQAVARNNFGQPLQANTAVGIKFQIHDLTDTGAVVFTESPTSLVWLLTL